jgi:hypothetical protein
MAFARTAPLLRAAVLSASLVALAGCVYSGDGGPPRLSLAPPDQTSPGLLIAPGVATHDDAYLNPFDPADQQQNQGHGLVVGPDDPSYFSLRF